MNIMQTYEEEKISDRGLSNHTIIKVRLICLCYVYQCSEIKAKLDWCTCVYYFSEIMAQLDCLITSCFMIIIEAN